MLQISAGATLCHLRYPLRQLILVPHLPSHPLTSVSIAALFLCATVLRFGKGDRERLEEGAENGGAGGEVGQRNLQHTVEPAEAGSLG